MHKNSVFLAQENHLVFCAEGFAFLHPKNQLVKVSAQTNSPCRTSVADFCDNIYKDKVIDFF